VQLRGYNILVVIRINIWNTDRILDSLPLQDRAKKFVSRVTAKVTGEYG